MIRFVTYAFPLLLLMLAVFGFAVEVLDLEPRSGAVIRLAVFDQSHVPATVVLGTWIMEACGLLALFLLAQGRCGAWWLDGLVAGWLAWVFRGPLLVLTVVVAARQPQGPWWDIALGWWILYSVCGLSLAILARRSGLVFPDGSEPVVEEEDPETTAEAVEEDPETEDPEAEGPEELAAERDEEDEDDEDDEATEPPRYEESAEEEPTADESVDEKPADEESDLHPRPAF